MCNFRSTSATLLKKHEKLHQKGTVDHNCAECEKQFKTKDNLIQHNKSCHKKIANKGDQCENSEENPEVLNKHKKVTSRNKTIPM